MRVFGADLGGALAEVPGGAGALVCLGPAGQVEAIRRLRSLSDLARDVVSLTGDEPFTLAVNVHAVPAERPGRPRPFESVLRRRLGFRPPAAGPVTGPAILAALAALDRPSVPWPDRARRRSGLAEVHAGLALKALLWERSPLAALASHPDREAAFRAYAPLPYRAADAPSRSGWADRAAALDLTLRGLGPRDDFDFAPAREALASASSDADVEQAGSLLDAAVLAGTAKRYLDDPEGCLFLGERERGYTILPADGFLRRLTRAEAGRPPRGALFPTRTLRERLSGAATLRPLELVAIPGKAARVEAVFETAPAYEFDNVDEMVWWKHCRHLDGPELPEEGLEELVVRLAPAADGSGTGDPPGGLRLVRSRHRVLSFRFDPPSVWRSRVATRDGRTYSFRVLRAVYADAASS